MSDEVRQALHNRQAVVALESTLIAHGLPYPVNQETALEAEEVIRAAGAVPATIAVLAGVPTVGLSPAQIAELARREQVRKASRRDLAAVIALQQTAATTVAATMALAAAAGIRVFATGGIGGAHRDAEPFDISADVVELARTPVFTICTGAKSLLHLPRTLEILETLGVPVLGYQTETFPAFYVGDPVPTLPVSARVETPQQAAAIFATHVRLGGGGALLAQACPAELAIPQVEFDAWLAQATHQAQVQGIGGPRLTPFLLARIAEASGGRTLQANRALIVANARLAAEVAVALTAQAAELRNPGRF
ncbi:MAG: pseudouridine-5'-phosphate glycosidase [Gemmataceae bacterium]|nr:pseudouridine-5'-phosphate glycosidase [Gemmata sp.]MDW8197298.1 pseudouridine-5'-phosphate glycosidase [Gemmataceae bacterium]